MKTILKKSVKSNFTTVPNNLLQNEELSWKATGMLVYLLGLPEDWNVNAADLENRKSDGRMAVKSALEELEEAGYLLRFKDRDESGLFVSTVYVRDDLNTPWPVHSIKPATDGQRAQVIRSGLSATENPQLLNTNNTKETKTKSSYSGQAAEQSKKTALEEFPIRGNREVATPSAADWDDSPETHKMMADRIAKNFYVALKASGNKRPAVKHKKMIELLEDLIERGYTEDEIEDIFSAHYKSKSPWTLNSIAFTEAKIQESGASDFDGWTEEEIAEYKQMKRDGVSVMDRVLKPNG